MAKTFKLNLISPGRTTITEEVTQISTKTSDGVVEFLANHAPIICSTIPTITTFVKADGGKESIFTSTGVITIKDNVLNFCSDSINKPEEIDRDRAEKALERANKRLHEDVKDKEKNIDVKRAERALARAKARLALK